MDTNVTDKSLDDLKKALSTPSKDVIEKVIGVGNPATGIYGYDLQAPAKNLYPVYTPIRNKIPRVGGGFAEATHWKQITSIVGSSFNNTPWVPEGQRSGQMQYVTTPKQATYVTLGEEDAVTFEGVNAGRNFEDVKATMVARLLQKFFLKEENAIIGGNMSIQLGTPVLGTLSNSNTGGALPDSTTYSCYVVALTQEGYYNSSVAGGVATRITVAGADGKSFIANGGSSALSNQRTVTTGSSGSAANKVTATVTPILGALAYAWFFGPAGSERLNQITTTNIAQITTLSSGSAQLANTITTDCSYNAGGFSGNTPIVTAFDGLLSSALNPANPATVMVMPNGATLTASGRGSVVEIDTILRAMWDTYLLGPSVIYVNSQEQTNITNKVIGAGNTALIKYEKGNTNEPFALTAGQKVSYYFNPYVPEGNMIPVLTHPKVPPGTIMMWTDQLPLYYQNNNVQNVAEIRTRQDYHAIDWVPTTRQWPTGVYSEQVLAVYATFAMAVITNITNG